jgi:hypothetical protein
MELDIWSQSFVGAMATLWNKIAAFIPNLIAALFIVLLGFVIAKVVDTLLSKGLAKLGLDRLMTGAGVNKLLKRIGINAPMSTVVGKVVYWTYLRCTCRRWWARL